MTRHPEPHERIGPPSLPETLWDLADPVPAALRLYGGSYRRWCGRFGVAEERRYQQDLGDVMEDILESGPEGAPPLLALQYRMWWLTMASPAMLAEGSIDWPDSPEHKTARSLVNLRRIYPILPWVRYDWRPTREEATDALAVVLATRPLTAKRFWCWQIAGWTSLYCRQVCEVGGTEEWHPASETEIARFRACVDALRQKHPPPPPPAPFVPALAGWYPPEYHWPAPVADTP